jgi:hypothetical protein
MLQNSYMCKDEDSPIFSSVKLLTLIDFCVLAVQLLMEMHQMLVATMELISNPNRVQFFKNNYTD